MPDDGSPPLGSQGRIPRIRRLGRSLQGLLAVSAAAGSLPLVRTVAAVDTSAASLLSTASLVLSIVVSIAWISWLYESRLLLDDLGIRSPISGLTRAWAALIFMPCVWMPLLLWSVYHLSRASDPAQLPPVVEEHMSTGGGFRDDPVVRVTTGWIARPVLALWIGTWVLSLAGFSLLMAGTSPTAYLLLQSVTSLVSALAAWQIVGAITHNLTELQRRERAR